MTRRGLFAAPVGVPVAAKRLATDPLELNAFVSCYQRAMEREGLAHAEFVREFNTYTRDLHSSVDLRQWRRVERAWLKWRELQREIERAWDRLTDQ